MNKLLTIAFAGCMAISAGAFAADAKKDAGKNATASDTMKKDCEAKAAKADPAKKDAMVKDCMSKDAKKDAPAKK